MLTVALLMFYTFSPVLTYAQTVTDTPTPTPDPSTVTPTPTPDPSTITPTPTDTLTPTPDPSAVTPTPDPSTVTPTPTPDPSSSTTTASNSADLTNAVDSGAITGDNTASGSATTNSDSSGGSSGSGGSSTQTGDAASLVNAQNSVNSTAVNSNVVDQTINIYVTQNGDLNLSDPFAVASNAIQAHPNDPVINVAFTNINNYVYLSNTINSLADTGNNTANGSATINTGNAYSVVNLLNQVNFTVLNSQIHIVTINIFGTLNGNIILPDPVNTSTNCSGCGVNIVASNSGDLTNNINATANTGSNTATGSATITTGDATSISNILNLLNTNIFGSNAQVLFINVLGNWLGNFIGWGNLSPESGGGNLTFFNLGPAASGTSGCSACTGNLNLNNFASILNTINSSANTGDNSLTGKGSITTGNAYSAVSLINFINSNFINSFGFFGFINIFGNWNGDIGGLSNFLALNNSGGDNSQSNTPQVASSDSTGTSPQEQGGLLNVTQTNNVGNFVLPGDTVTFSIKVKNTGTGRVYGTKLSLFLIYQGQNAGGTTYNLGDITGGSGRSITTGFVLSKDAPPGLYIARAVATGNVGPNSGSVTSFSDSSFTVFGSPIITTQPPKTAVLGTNSKTFSNRSAASEDALYLTLIILLTFAYVSMRLVRKRKYIYEVISSPTFKEKLVSIKMLML